MNGFPRVLATGADVRNCLAMVQMGQLAPEGLKRAIEAIEARAYIDIPIREMSDNRKTVIVLDCAELAQGVAVDNKASTSIAAVERATQQDAPEGDGTAEAAQYATVTLTRALPASVAILRISAPHDPYAEMGTTKAEISAIKEVLSNYA